MYHALKDLFPGGTVQELLVSASPGWSAFNPSIAFSPVEGYRIIVRSSNYVLDKYGQYNVRDPDGTIRTRNFIGTLDSTLNLVDLHLIRTCQWSERIEFPQVRGLEDARLYWAGDHWQVYGTLREQRWDGLCQIATARLEHDQLVDPQLYEHPTPGRPEKNWQIIGAGPHFVYTCNPSAMIHHGIYRCEWKEPYVNDVSKEFRGGSPLIPLFGNAYMAIIHEVDWSTGHRRYFHRFVQFDLDGTMTGFTEPFYFVFDHLIDDEPMIEYAAGLVEHEDHYVVSFGFKDSRCFLARIPRGEVLREIRPAF